MRKEESEMGLFDRISKKTNRAEETTVPPTSAEPEAESAGGASLFGRLRQGLSRTSRLLNTDIRDLFKQEGQLRCQVNCCISLMAPFRWWYQALRLCFAAESVHVTVMAKGF